MPPVTVPPLRFHDPVAVLSVSVCPSLLSTPVMLTNPPLRVKFARFASVNIPPRLRSTHAVPR